MEHLYLYLKNSCVFLNASFSILEAYFSLLGTPEKKRTLKKNRQKTLPLSLSETEPVKIDTSLINKDIFSFKTQGLLFIYFSLAFSELSALCMI